MAVSKAYGVYWGTCFATVITWQFAMNALTNDAWISVNGNTNTHLGTGCYSWSDAFCDRLDAATAFQFMATTTITFALVVVLIAAFSSPPTTGRLGLTLGIMLAFFSLFELVTFALMAGAVAEDDDYYQVEVASTLGVAVMAWFFGLAGAIIILVLSCCSLATKDHEGPFRMCMSGGGGVAGGASAGQHVGTV